MSRGGGSAVGSETLSWGAETDPLLRGAVETFPEMVKASPSGGCTSPGVPVSPMLGGFREPQLHLVKLNTQKKVTVAHPC